MKTILQLTDQDITSHAGLLLIAPYLRNREFRQEIQSVSRLKKTSGVVSDVDVIVSWIGLLTLGKNDYAAIEEYRKDKHFKRTLDVHRVPSEETLRQRIETLPPELVEILRQYNQAILSGAFDLSKQYGKRDKHQEAVTIGDQTYAVIDSDVSVLDNSNTKKEGVEWTYKKCDGYAPIFSYMGASGYMLNCELREGSMHSNAAGTLDYFADTLLMGKAVTDLPLLMVLDSGYDDKHLLDLFEEHSAFYVVKRNLRKESSEEWLKTAKSQSSFQRTRQDGSNVYYASIKRTIMVEKRTRDIRIVVVARERIHDADGQMLLVPEISVETYWTNLLCTDRDVESVYRMHGTMEQYHAELKSDMGIERLPSGKFHANSLHLLFSMIAFNLLRRVGKTLLTSQKTPGNRGRRLRLRTVIQNVMYMAGVIIHHAGQVMLRVCTGHAWAKAFHWSYVDYASG